jgi:hypothetical protein
VEIQVRQRIIVSLFDHQICMDERVEGADFVYIANMLDLEDAMEH